MPHRVAFSVDGTEKCVDWDWVSGPASRSQRRAHAAAATKSETVRSRGSSRIQVSPGRLESAIVRGRVPRGVALIPWGQPVGGPLGTGTRWERQRRETPLGSRSQMSPDPKLLALTE